MFKTMFIGVGVILALCLWFLDGTMAPAVWQLTSIIWIFFVYRVYNS